MFNLVLVFLASVLVGYFVSLPVIWLLKVFRIGQFIRPECPSSHKLKAGTPTMGGIAPFITILIFVLILINVNLSIGYAALMILFVGNAALGFFDDLLKIRKRQNRGIAPWQKLLGQVIFASAFAGLLIYLGHADGVSGILKGLHMDIPYVYLPFIVLVIIGTSNAVNLSDGLDGLAGGSLSIAFIAFGIIAFRLQLMNEALISMVAAGAMLSFLRFNFYRAQVFMGDVGSLALGTLLSGIAVLLHKELLLIVVGGIFVIEALSVILQVSSFKLFKRRIFRMSPIHHHFELLGISEPIIVGCFYVVAAAFAGLGILLYRIL